MPAIPVNEHYRPWFVLMVICNHGIVEVILDRRPRGVKAHEGYHGSRVGAPIYCNVHLY